MVLFCYSKSLQALIFRTQLLNLRQLPGKIPLTILLDNLVSFFEQLLALVFNNLSLVVSNNKFLQADAVFDGRPEL